MCGILCLIQHGGDIDCQKINQCMDKLSARGPDKMSSQIIQVNDKSIVMGFTRLAIMDTSDAGLQPFTDKLGNSVICNGEIYNFRELATKHSIELTSGCDCEILLPLYHKIGFEKMVSFELDAEFATVILDKQQNKIFAARDRYGVRPLYYGENKTTGIQGFASELKALHPIMEFVRQVVPNEIITIDLSTGMMSDNLDVHEYYSFNDIVPCSIDVMDAQREQQVSEPIREKIRELLIETVKKRLTADRKIGFLLSGGLDSSLIVAIATKLLGPENIVCFSIGIDGSPDVIAAKQVVEYLKIKNHHIIPFSVEQGLSVLPDVIAAIETYDTTTIRASTPQYIMAKYISENTDIRVLLSGEGSDEIHGSYRYFRDAPGPCEFHAETIRLLRELCYFDNKRTDRSMACWGLEVRVPFLDFAYVDYITKLNPRLLMFRRDYMEKMIIRDSFKSWLPDEILYRSKEAFSDAVSNNEVNWAKSIQVVAESQITTSELANNEFEFNTPKTIDALHFRRIFAKIYPARDTIIDHYWLPRFQKTEVYDPSARVLACYN